MTVFRRLRLLASMSAQEAADRIGVSKTNALHWEAGRTRPRASRLKKIAAVYGCTVADLLDDEPRINGKSSPECRYDPAEYVGDNGTEANAV